METGSDLTRTWTLPSEEIYVAIVRKLVIRQLRTWGYPLNDSQAYDITLVASELVANGVRHGESAHVTVLATASTTELFFGVMDGSTDQPIIVMADQDEESGRGLEIVSALTSCLGIQSTPRGKLVWITMPLPARDPARGLRRQLSPVSIPTGALRAS